MFEWCTVLAGFNTVPGRLDADQSDGFIGNKPGKCADSVGTATDTGDHRIRKTSFTGEDLGAGLITDHALELADNRRVRMRTCRGT